MRLLYSADFFYVNHISFASKHKHQTYCNTKENFMKIFASMTQHTAFWCKHNCV